MSAYNTLQILDHEFVLSSLDGFEGCSQAFYFNCGFLLDDNSFDVDSCCEQIAKLTLCQPHCNSTSSKKSRNIFAKVTLIKEKFLDNSAQRLLTVRMESKLSALKFSASGRVFQNKSLKQVLYEVLQEHGFSSTDIHYKCIYEHKLDKICIAYPYETDWQFLQRLLHKNRVIFVSGCHASAETITFFDEFSAFVHRQVKMTAEHALFRSGRMLSFKTQDVSLCLGMSLSAAKLFNSFLIKQIFHSVVQHVQHQDKHSYYRNTLYCAKYDELFANKSLDDAKNDCVRFYQGQVVKKSTPECGVDYLGRYFARFYFDEQNKHITQTISRCHYYAGIRKNNFVGGVGWHFPIYPASTVLLLCLHEPYLLGAIANNSSYRPLATNSSAQIVLSVNNLGWIMDDEKSQPSITIGDKRSNYFKMHVDNKPKFKVVSKSGDILQHAKNIIQYSCGDIVWSVSNSYESRVAGSYKIQSVAAAIKIFAADRITIKSLVGDICFDAMKNICWRTSGRLALCAKHALQLKTESGGDLNLSSSYLSFDAGNNLVFSSKSGDVTLGNQIAGIKITASGVVVVYGQLLSLCAAAIECSGKVNPDVFAC